MLVYLFLSICRSSFFFFFFFNDTATTEIYTLSLHDALPICSLNALASCMSTALSRCCPTRLATSGLRSRTFGSRRSEWVALGEPGGHPSRFLLVELGTLRK